MKTVYINIYLGGKNNEGKHSQRKSQDHMEEQRC